MTITAQTSKTGPYNGNGTTTVFSYTFEVQDEAHLVVTLADASGVETVQVLNTDYTVSGVDNPNGGQITMSTAPASGYTLTISRNIPITQEVDLENRRSVAPEVLEDACDKLTQIAQDFSEQLGRSLKVAVSDTDPADLPIGDRAGQFLAFDAGGDPTYASGTGADGALRADLASTDAGKGSALVSYQLDEATAVSRTVEARLRDAVSVKDFGAVGDGVTDDTAAIQAALDTGRNVFFSEGTYKVTSELEVTTVGQVIEFQNTGGYAYGEDIGANWSARTRIVAHGTFTPRIRTRRLFRGSVSDPQDAALSVVLNIQAENVHLVKVCVWLNTDYSDATPTNYGDDIDVGIFVGTRVGTQMVNPQVIGYFRRAGVYFDVSNATNLPRFNDLSGSAYPDGSVKNGGDGTHLYNPYIRGGRVGLAILGAKPKSGETDYSDDYYDEILGTTVNDSRGSFGFSDFAVFGGRIYGPEHHSNYRLKDPELDGGVLSETSLGDEPDNAPAAVHIDGLAGNSSSNLWGMRFIGTRIATFEALRVRLDKASRIAFFGSHIEGRNSGTRKDTSGTIIDTNDYTDISYGDIAATDQTDRITVYSNQRQDYADGLAPHFYGDDKPLLITDSGRIFLPSYMQSEGDLDLRAGSSSYVILRQDDQIILTVDELGVLLGKDAAQVRADDGQELDLRSASGEDLLLRSGPTTIALFPAAGIYATTTGQPANVYITATNTFQRSTSAAKYKTDIQLITDADLDLFLQLDGVSYLSLCEADDSTRRFSGIVADQAHNLGLTDLVVYNDDNEVEGFAYERATAYLLEIIKRRVLP